MRDYNGYSAEERRKHNEEVKKLIKEGKIESPYKLKCERCGQDKGIREYHCVDYDLNLIFESLRCLCYKCHRYLHVYELGETHKYYKNAKTYFDQVKNGHIYKPVFDYKEFNWNYENTHFGATDATR